MDEEPPEPTGESALIQAVRCLNQKGDNIYKIAQGLEQAWRALCQKPSSSFQSAEVMLLRWLLKIMEGPEAEQVRRYPLTWTVLGAIFARISAFSLGKTLADRHFVNILHQTLKEISVPHEGSKGTPSPKRKRQDPLTVEVDLQKETTGCLHTAEALFLALTCLASKSGEPVGKVSPNRRIGPELLKSLFYTADSKQMMEMGRDMLRVCQMALECSQMYDDEAQWVSTFIAIWNLHGWNDSHLADVAITLSGPAINLLGRLTGSRKDSPLPEDTIETRWSRELRQFLTRNLILPVRASFLNRQDAGVLDIVLSLSAVNVEITFPTLFDLAIKAPCALGGQQAAKQSTTAWARKVFDMMEKAMGELRNERAKTAAMRDILTSAVHQIGSLSLSLPSLRTICQKYAFSETDGNASVDWTVLLSLVRLNPDVFLIPKAGRDFFADIVRETNRRHTDQTWGESDFQSATEFVVTLVQGATKARELSDFLKRWLDALCAADRPSQRWNSPDVWIETPLVEAVAREIQGSLSAGLLSEVLNWVQQQQEDPTRQAASVFILEAIARGITREDFIERVGTRVFSLAMSVELPDALAGKDVAAQWTVAEKTFGWASLEDAETMWPETKAKVSGVLRDALTSCEGTFAAFRCVVAAWLAAYPNGSYQEDAARVTCAFIERLQKEQGEGSDSSPPATATSIYTNWIMKHCSRLLSLLEKRGSDVAEGFLDLVFARLDKPAGIGRQESLSAIFEALLGNETNLNDSDLMTRIVRRAIQLLKHDTWRSPTIAAPVSFLLHVPLEDLSADQRAEVVTAVWSHLSKSDAREPHYRESWKRNLSLLVRLVREPATFELLPFKFIFYDLTADWQPTSPSMKENSDWISFQEICLELMEELTALSFEQALQGTGKEPLRYLEEAIQVMTDYSWKDDILPHPRASLLKVAVSQLQRNKKDWAAALPTLQGKLFAMAVNFLDGFLKIWRRDSSDLSPRYESLLKSLDQFDIFRKEEIVQEVASRLDDLVVCSQQLIGQGRESGWRIRLFLSKYFSKGPSSILETSLTSGDAKIANHPRKPFFHVDSDTVLDYVDGVVADADEGAKLDCLAKLLNDDDPAPDTSISRLLIIYRVIELTADSKTLPSTPGNTTTQSFDLATAHRILCDRLLTVTRTDQFVMIAQTLHLLLGQKPLSMVQWSFEHTLSTVSIICAKTTSTAAFPSPRLYPYLCRLVQVIVQLHRKRLYGHFPLLVTTLSTLLRALPPTTPNAKLFARLLTLVCEPPTTTSTSTNHAILESEKLKARRYAGQYMYTLLMVYAQRLVSGAAGGANVHAALGPGVHAVLDVTTSKRMKMVMDAADPAGRAVLREIWRRWDQCGKWNGV